MFDCIIIGGGVVGASVLDALALRGLKTLLLERDDDVATGASRANSGISHAGYDCVPDTLKAKFNVSGNAMMPRLTAELDVPYKKTGSLVLAKKDGLAALEQLAKRGAENGVDCRIIRRDEIERLQPDTVGDIEYALYAPEAGVVSPYKLTIALCDRAILNGAAVKLNSEVTDIGVKDNIFTVKTLDCEYSAKYVINAAGENASAVNAMLGETAYGTEYKKGEYFVLDSVAGGSVKRVLFPLPDERGKGILAAPTADGNVIYGPTSTDCEKGDTSVTASGLAAVREGVSRIIRMPEYRKVIREYAGVRSVVGDDFIVKQSEVIENYYILAGICSPGLTSAPAIGEFIAEAIASRENPIAPENPVIKLKHEKLKDFTPEVLNKKIAEDEKWGRIICRCEKVSEAEIVNAIRSPLPATTVDAVKRRVRAGMGRCQGGFCAPRVMEILARELNVQMTEVRKGGKGSELAICRVKEDAE